MAAECSVAGSSSQATCRGIQGTGKNADICCAFECECTCGGTNAANQDKECFITEIRKNPPAVCTGDETDSEACSLEPEATEDTCGVDGIKGIANSRGDLCCPIGCGQCGGSGCSTIPMSWVQPGTTPLSVAGGVPVEVTSADYCCDAVSETITDICGVDGAEPPCLIGNVAGVSGNDTCGVAGLEGIANEEGYLCCPIGCTVCGGAGCGAASLSDVFPGAIAGTTTAKAGTTTSDYCCNSAIDNTEGYCGDEGVGTPCRIRAADKMDTCLVEGIEGVSDPTQTRCCPIGCGKCTGARCGSTNIYFVVDDLDSIEVGETSASYCCDSAFGPSTKMCGVGVGESKPPCLISEGIGSPLEPLMADSGEGSEVVDCDTISVEVDAAQMFTGIYSMNGTDATTFVRNDGGAVLVYDIPGDSMFLPGVEAMMSNDISLSADVSSQTGVFSSDADYVTVVLEPLEIASSSSSPACGNWLLLHVVDGVMQEFPQVSVEDCAEHPLDISPDTFWVTQNGSHVISDQPGTGLIECVTPTMAPTPVPTMAPTLAPVKTTSSPVAIELSPTDEPLSPSTAPASVGGENPTVVPPTAITGGESSSGSDSKGLGQTGTIVVAAVAGAALLVGLAGLARWKKRRNEAS